ncbi:MAG: GTP cyclohydrolase II [Anaerolineae bacterium]|nr:GTP cyclohydrolase II [Anaerolineae bacterium]
MTKQTVEKVTCARIPTESGEFQLCYYQSDIDDKEHLALVHGDVAGKENVLVRIHSECFTGDVLGSLRCDCGEQLQRAMQLVAAEGAGIVVYLRQEGRGIGLLDKLRAYNLQDEGYDTVDANLMLGHQADGRDYTIAGLILQDLGVHSIQLLTNNPDKIEKLQALDIEVAARVALPADVNEENAVYLRTKVERMRHLLDLNTPPPVSPLPDVFPTNMVRNGRCFVTLSFAQSLDGSITVQRGQYTAISGSESMYMTHQLRSVHQAILVGIGTVLADDPQLSVRLVDGQQPQPVVVDSHLRVPLTAKLFEQPRMPWIFTTHEASEARQTALEAQGARVIRVDAAAGMVSLTAVLDFLYQAGLKTVMVEGGARIITSFLAAKLVDHLVVTIAPKILGGLHAVEYLNGSGLPHLENARYQILGSDMVLSGEVEW